MREETTDTWTNKMIVLKVIRDGIDKQLISRSYESCRKNNLE